MRYGYSNQQALCKTIAEKAGITYFVPDPATLVDPATCTVADFVKKVLAKYEREISVQALNTDAGAEIVNYMEFAVLDWCNNGEHDAE